MNNPLPNTIALPQMVDGFKIEIDSDIFCQDYIANAPVDIRDDNALTYSSEDKFVVDLNQPGRPYNVNNNKQPSCDQSPGKSSERMGNKHDRIDLKSHLQAKGLVVFYPLGDKTGAPHNGGNSVLKVQCMTQPCQQYFDLTSDCPDMPLDLSLPKLQHKHTHPSNTIPSNLSHGLVEALTNTSQVNIGRKRQIIHRPTPKYPVLFHPAGQSLDDRMFSNFSNTSNPHRIRHTSSRNENHHSNVNYSHSHGLFGCCGKYTWDNSLGGLQAPPRNLEFNPRLYEKNVNTNVAPAPVNGMTCLTSPLIAESSKIDWQRATSSASNATGSSLLAPQNYLATPVPISNCKNNPKSQRMSVLHKASTKSKNENYSPNINGGSWQNSQRQRHGHICKSKDAESKKEISKRKNLTTSAADAECSFAKTYEKHIDSRRVSDKIKNLTLNVHKLEVTNNLTGESDNFQSKWKRRKTMPTSDEVSCVLNNSHEKTQIVKKYKIELPKKSKLSTKQNGLNFSQNMQISDHYLEGAENVQNTVIFSPKAKGNCERVLKKSAKELSKVQSAIKNFTLSRFKQSTNGSYSQSSYVCMNCHLKCDSPLSLVEHHSNVCQLEMKMFHATDCLGKTDIKHCQCTYCTFCKGVFSSKFKVFSHCIRRCLIKKYFHNLSDDVKTLPNSFNEPTHLPNDVSEINNLLNCDASFPKQGHTRQQLHVKEKSLAKSKTLAPGQKEYSSSSSHNMGKMPVSTHPSSFVVYMDSQCEDSGDETISKSPDRILHLEDGTEPTERSTIPNVCAEMVKRRDKKKPSNHTYDSQTKSVEAIETKTKFCDELNCSPNMCSVTADLKTSFLNSVSLTTKNKNMPYSSSKEDRHGINSIDMGDLRYNSCSFNIFITDEDDILKSKHLADESQLDHTLQMQDIKIEVNDNIEPSPNHYQLDVVDITQDIAKQLPTDTRFEGNMPCIDNNLSTFTLYFTESIKEPASVGVSAINKTCNTNHVLTNSATSSITNHGSDIKIHLPNNMPMVHGELSNSKKCKRSRRIPKREKHNDIKDVVVSKSFNNSKFPKQSTDKEGKDYSVMNPFSSPHQVEIVGPIRRTVSLNSAVAFGASQTVDKNGKKKKLTYLLDDNNRPVTVVEMSENEEEEEEEESMKPKNSYIKCDKCWQGFPNYLYFSWHLEYSCPYTHRLQDERSSKHKTSVNEPQLSINNISV